MLKPKHQSDWSIPTGKSVRRRRCASSTPGKADVTGVSDAALAGNGHSCKTWPNQRPLLLNRYDFLKKQDTACHNFPDQFKLLDARHIANLINTDKHQGQALIGYSSLKVSQRSFESWRASACQSGARG